MNEESQQFLPNGIKSIEYDKYEFYIVCKTCGVINNFTLTAAEAKQSPRPIENHPAKAHHDRTGHTVAELCYTKAPPDIQEMLDGGSAEEINWVRVGNWLEKS